MVDVIEICGFEQPDTVISVCLMSFELLEKVAERYSEPFIFHERFMYSLIVRSLSNVVFWFHDKEAMERARKSVGTETPPPGF